MDDSITEPLMLLILRMNSRLSLEKHGSTGAVLRKQVYNVRWAVEEVHNPTFCLKCTVMMKDWYKKLVSRQQQNECDWKNTFKVTLIKMSAWYSFPLIKSKLAATGSGSNQSFSTNYLDFFRYICLLCTSWHTHTCSSSLMNPRRVGCRTSFLIHLDALLALLKHLRAERKRGRVWCRESIWCPSVMTRSVRDDKVTTRNIRTIRRPWRWTDYFVTTRQWISCMFVQIIMS